jgi:hypothetical protein
VIRLQGIPQLYNLSIKSSDKNQLDKLDTSVVSSDADKNEGSKKAGTDKMELSGLRPWGFEKKKD